MTEQYLTPRDRIVLMALMAVAAEVSNKDLHAAVGFTIEAPTRERLVRQQLLTARRPGRAYLYELSEPGWAWCRTEMAAGAPARSDAGTRVLYLAMRSVMQHLDREGRTPSWIFHPAPVSEPGDLGERIRHAYQELAALPGDWVRLVDVRHRLGDTPRETVDGGLRQLLDAEQIVLAPEADQQRLTPDDRAAAITVGGRDQHLLVVRSA